MGRPATPAQLKVIEGNFRADRHSHGPVVEIGLPPCPKWLPRRARKHWDQLGAELVKVGLISVVDGSAFTLHCDSFGKYQEATEKLKTLQDLQDETPNGLMIQSALFTIRNKLWDQVLSSAKEFGLTPAARSKVQASPQETLDFGDDGSDSAGPAKYFD